jgi:hypothetical protein
MKSLSIVFIELSMDRQAQWGHTTVYLPNFVKVCPITDILIDYTSFKYFLGSEGKLRSSVHCENPHHKQHMENFSRTFPTADREGTFVIISWPKIPVYLRRSKIKSRDLLPGLHH